MQGGCLGQGVGKCDALVSYILSVTFFMVNALAF